MTASRCSSWLVRWCGLAVCTVLAAGYPVLVWWNVGAYPCRRCVVGTEGGCIGVGWAIDATPVTATAPSCFAQREFMDLLKWDWLPRAGSTASQRWVMAPVWSLLLVAAVPTALAWRAERRRRRRARFGRCPRCNYDLAGLAPATPCPECGGTRQPGA